jgi:fructuronate reductase
VRPRSAIGLLAAGLAQRRAAGDAPFTVLCCDNLPRNGDTVRRLVLDFAGARDRALADWIGDAVAFPNTMVDRIVPATTDADRAAVAARLGLTDAWPVVCEPFRQWVVEDRFPAGRPAWEAAGAELVADVAPYEAMKLRLLNASHSALAYLGGLAGFGTIAEAVADPALHRFVAALMAEEAAPTLAVPAGTDPDAYRASVLHRFANPALGHRTAQVAMDGSQKLPVRLLGTVRDRLAAGAPCPRLALVVAAWMRHVAGPDDRGRPLDLHDPLAGPLRAHAASAGPDPARLAGALLGVRAVFGDDLPRAAPFVAAVTDGLRRLDRLGARRAAATFAPGDPARTGVG